MHQSGKILAKLLIAILLIGLLLLAGLYWILRPAEVSLVDINALAEQRAAAFDSSLPSFEALPQTDLPPEGTRSLFDHIIAQNGVLPYPYDSLVELLASYDVNGKPPTQVLIPDGRSLLKGFADFHRPRTVLATNPKLAESDFELGPMLKGRLFLGFVEDADEVEVVSYNEMAGRFEFQLVKDYCQGCVPKLVYASRALCTTCHQSLGPIFSVRPWQETNGQPEIAKQIARARGLSEQELATTSYASVPVVNPLSAPETIDDLSDVGNVIPTTQRIWIDGCGAEGNDCRRLMLELALSYLWNPGGFSTDTEDFQRLVSLQQKHWPEAGIALNNNDLNNRDPLNQPATGFIDQLRAWFADDEPQQASLDTEGADDNEVLNDFEKQPPLPPELDPLNQRIPKAILKADTENGVVGIAQLFSANDQRLLELHSGYNVDALRKAARSEAVSSQLDAKPFRRVPIMLGLLEALGVAQLPSSSFTDASAMSEPMLDGVEPLAISEGSVLTHFETYCFACHRGNPNAELNFMGGETEQIVLERIKETSSISDVLDYERYLGTAKAGELMPPASSYQRAVLEKNAAEGEQHLEAMRDTMPSLFDF